ncbi:MAG TPA: hypothetical protein VNZ03_01480 [Terriglobales bacterium]|nr:hypothetical protein [Terriglobales bacterium]
MHSKKVMSVEQLRAAIQQLREQISNGVIGPGIRFGAVGHWDLPHADNRPGHLDFGHLDDSHQDRVHLDSHSDVSFSDTGHNDTGHDDTGHSDTGHSDTGHDDAGHDDAGHDDGSGFRNQLNWLIDEFEEILVVREQEILQNIEQRLQTTFDKILTIISAQTELLAAANIKTDVKQGSAKGKGRRT